jgi:ankyrin repeat protein
MVQLLLERGAVLRGDKYASSPLIPAIASGNVEFVKLFLDLGADMMILNEVTKV